MNKRMAIIGANEQQNPLIQKAHQLGFETHVFAWQTGAVGEQTADFFYPISAENKEEILQQCRKLQVCAVVSIGSDVSAQSAAYVCENLGLTSNTYASVVCATNKLLTRNILKKCNICQPDFVEVGDSIPGKLREMNYPLVVKPSDRSGGRGLCLVQSQHQLMRAINQAREASFERKAIVEEYVSGQLFSCECISFDGGHQILGYTRRSTMTVGGRICEYAHTQPANLPSSAREQMQQLSGRVLNALGLRFGASSIEFILGDDGRIALIEVTPTMYGDFIGTHLIPMTRGYDYLDMVISIATGNAPLIPSPREEMTAKVRFLYQQEDLRAARADCENAVEQTAQWPDYLPADTDGHRYGYCITSRTYKPYGGCTPLELPDGSAWFKQPATDSLLGLNSEYTAFWYALQQTDAERIHMPYYCSPTWCRIAQESEKQIVYYHIGTDFLPEDLCYEPQDLVLLVNYHGLCRDFIRTFTAGHRNTIIDNSMDFYAKPILADGVYNIYACRKYFAVPDGAYLIGTGLTSREPIPLAQDISYKRGIAMLKALELGESAAYKEQQAIEQTLAQERAFMSRLTQRMLAATDYALHARRRRENFDYLHARLEKFQLLTLNTGAEAVPQFYPLLVGGDIRSSLVSKKIYVPLMWRKLVKPEFAGTSEQKLAQRLLCLPIDPRYSENDMEYLAQIITSLLD